MWPTDHRGIQVIRPSGGSWRDDGARSIPCSASQVVACLAGTSPTFGVSVMSAESPVAELRKAESRLLGAVGRAEQLADEIGAGALEEAIDRFEVAVGRASDRLNHAKARLALLAGGLLADLCAFTSAVDADVNANGPAPQQLGYTPSQDAPSAVEPLAPDEAPEKPGAAGSRLPHPCPWRYTVCGRSPHTWSIKCHPTQSSQSITAWSGLCASGSPACRQPSQASGVSRTASQT